MEELMQKLSGYLDAAAGVITEYAPKAVDAALAVVRIDAVFHLVLSVLLLGALVWAAKFTWRIAERASQLDEERKYDQAMAHGVRALIVGFVSVLGVVIGGVSGKLFAILNVYYWLAAVDPMLGLVYKAAQSAGLL